jgi:hypothetical protein
MVVNHVLTTLLTFTFLPFLGTPNSLTTMREMVYPALVEVAFRFPHLETRLIASSSLDLMIFVDHVLA